jgi:hypothetical protein
VGEDHGVSDRKSPVEQALDLFVYAPIGFLAMARDELPKLVERGHQELSQQATVAKMMGEYAVGEGQKEAGKRLQQASETITAITSTLGERRRPSGRRSTGGPAPSTSAAPAPPASSAAPSSAPAPSGPPVVTPPPAPASAPAPPPPPVDGLAIPGYDALSASQVVQRLAGLSGDELEAVRSYEAATRGRKTILNRVEQLRTGSPS